MQTKKKHQTSPSQTVGTSELEREELEFMDRNLNPTQPEGMWHTVGPKEESCNHRPPLTYPNQLKKDQLTLAHSKSLYGSNCNSRTLLRGKKTANMASHTHAVWGIYPIPELIERRVTRYKNFSPKRKRTDQRIAESQLLESTANRPRKEYRTRQQMSRK